MSLTHQRLESAANFAAYHELFEDAFPETAGTPLESPEHYAWKYGAAGKPAPAFEFAAFEDGRMLGYYAALPFVYRVSGRRSLAALVCDVMTHSASRGKGVFTAQGRYATDTMAKCGVEFCTGYPIRSYVFPGHLKIGWRIAFPLPVYCKILDPAPILRTRHAGRLGIALRPLCSGYHHVCRLVRPGVRGSGCRRFAPAEFFATEQFATFYAKWARGNENHLERSAAFYGWRLNAPQAVYTVSAVYAEKELAGFAIARSSRLSGFAVTAIVDFMLLPGHRRLAGALHDDLARLSRENGTAGLIFMTTKSVASRAALLRNGYLRSHIQFKLILKWLGAGEPPATFWDEPPWHLTWVDTDNL